MLVTVHVHTRSSRQKTEWREGILEVWVTASPVKGAANRAILDAVARELGVVPSAVRLRSGGRGRTKLVEVDK